MLISLSLKLQVTSRITALAFFIFGGTARSSIAETSHDCLLVRNPAQRHRAECDLLGKTALARDVALFQLIVIVILATADFPGPRRDGSLIVLDALFQSLFYN